MDRSGGIDMLNGWVAAAPCFLVPAGSVASTALGCESSDNFCSRSVV
uniref:Uncharacterized protein n=1 Tax=Arundo donax TaxID=35708 RepID=A0A0A9EYI5_ARUDO